MSIVKLATNDSATDRRSPNFASDCGIAPSFFRLYDMAPTAIVVGAGAGGVAAAARLAHAGFSVTIIEQHEQVGGRCSLITTDEGYRFDVGPSLLLLPRLFHRAFEEIGTSLEQEGVKLVRCDPNYVVHFGDGEAIKLSSDLAIMKQEVERFEGEQGFAKSVGPVELREPAS